MFASIPGKELQTTVPNEYDIWPDYADLCEVNLFHRQYVASAGYLGEAYLNMWSRQEIEDFKPFIAEAFPERFHFFGSDGGGNQFGFYWDGEKPVYISAPNIGGEEDIRILGSWEEMLELLRGGDYI